MPTPTKFLKAFGLTKGAKFGNYQIVSVVAHHETIEEYQLYEYHIKLVLSPLSSSSYKEMDKTDNLIIQVIKKSHDVKATRNYYRCEIDPPSSYFFKNNGNMEYDLVGYGKRI